MFSSTEFLEPGPTVGVDEFDAYLAEFPSIIAESDVVTLSGSLPAGMDKDSYRRLVRLALDKDKRVILDSSGEELRLGLEAGPTMIKPNQDEIEALLGATATAQDNVVTQARSLREDGVEQVVISLGKDGALLACEEGCFRAIPPKVRVANTVGCGDSMVAAFAVAFERAMAPREALAYAIAVASAAAMSPNTGEYDPADRDAIMSHVEVRAID